ncbi:glycosyltransferase [Serratia fonticola]
MNQFTLQSAAFPCEELCPQASLYFHGDTTIVFDSVTAQLTIPEKEEVSFDSFFNAFSLYKWKKHTKINHLGFYANIAGHGIATVYWINGADIRILHQQECTASLHIRELQVDGLDQGRLYFHWRSLADSKISDFGFTTCNSPRQENRLAIVITTFNREKIILSTLQRITTQLLSDEDFYDKVTLYVVNNGSDFTVPSAENIVYLKNKNLGGAGGFSRGLMEVKQRGNEQFCLFMDDDAACEIESIKRAYRLLCFSNKKQQMIAGCMLYEEQPGTVYEAGALYPYKQLRMQPLKIGVDITTSSGLDEFDRDDVAATYAGWWFCAFDVSSIKHYAFPFFVRGDDILFCVMHGYEIVTLNGISSWQMDFKRKYSAMVEYLSVRGLLVPAFLYPSLKKRLAIAYWVLAKVLLLCFSYRYSSAQAILEAYHDVLAGPDFWTGDVDASEARKRITTLAQDEVANLDEWNINAEWVTDTGSEARWHKIMRLCLLNGHLVPSIFFASRPVRIPNTEIHPTHHVFLNNYIFYFNDESKKSIAVHHSKLRFYILLARTLKLIVGGFFKYPHVVSSYKNKISYLTSEAFWKKHF